MRFKIYTTNKSILENVASDFNIELDFLKEGCGEGYVSDGKYLRVFAYDSQVDHDTEINNFTEAYVNTKFFTL